MIPTKLRLVKKPVGVEACGVVVAPEFVGTMESCTDFLEFVKLESREIVHAAEAQALAVTEATRLHAFNESSGQIANTLLGLDELSKKFCLGSVQAVNQIVGSVLKRFGEDLNDQIALKGAIIELINQHASQLKSELQVNPDQLAFVKANYTQLCIERNFSFDSFEVSSDTSIKPGQARLKTPKGALIWCDGYMLLSKIQDVFNATESKAGHD